MYWEVAKYLVYCQANHDINGHGSDAGSVTKTCRQVPLDSIWSDIAQKKKCFGETLELKEKTRIVKSTHIRFACTISKEGKI